MFCPNCGVENSSSAKFCKSCGEKFFQVHDRIAQTQQADSLSASEKWNFTKKQKIIAAISGVALLLVVGGVIAFNKSTQKHQVATSANLDNTKSTAPVAQNSIADQPPVALKTETYFSAVKDFSDNKAWVQSDTSSPWECIDDKGETLFSLDTGEVPKTDFMENGAWVQKDPSHLAYVDDKGNTLFSLDENSTLVTDFTKGAAIIKNQDGVENIIDKNGTVVFPKDDGYTYQFGSSYGNYYFVTRHVNTFEKTEDQTGIVDNAGKWIIEPTNDLAERHPLLGFEGSPYGIIDVNYNDNDFYDANVNEFFKSAEYSGGNAELLRRVVKSSYTNDLVFLVSDYGGNLYLPSMGSYNHEFGNLGFIKNTHTGFYDQNHDLAIDLSSYDGLELIGWISDGYFSVSLKNPQNNTFYTVIDKKGNKMFEPISDPISKVSCGRVLVSPKEGSQYYIDVNGKTVISDITGGSDFNENCLAKITKANSGEKSAIHYIDVDGNIAF